MAKPDLKELQKQIDLLKRASCLFRNYWSFRYSKQNTDREHRKNPRIPEKLGGNGCRCSKPR